MRIVVVADSRMPAASDYPGHGLGKSMLAIAEGLLARGHTVALVAAEGSKATCEVITAESETDLARKAFTWGPDVVIDGSHEHRYQSLYPGYPVVNRSGDREQKPGKNAVYVSKAQAAYFGEPHGRVIYTGVDVNDYPRKEGAGGLFLLWLGPVNIGHKQVHLAVQVASKAGWPLIIAGTGSMQHEGFIGPVSGEGKLALMQQAAAVLITGLIEAGPRTAIEAAACGTPVVGLDAGGTPEYICNGVSGFCGEAGALAGLVTFAMQMPPERVRAWVQAERNLEQMITGYEKAALEAVRRETVRPEAVA